MEQCLRRAGFQIVPAGASRRGGSLGRPHPADAVIVCLSMLDATGLSARSKLRAQYPPLPIIAVCCGPGVANLSGFARCAGATLTVEPPLDADAPLAAVEVALGLPPSADGRLMP